MWLPGALLLFGVLGAIIGKGKQRGWEGFLLGFFLGPLGCVVAAALQPSGPECPFCGGPVPPSLPSVCPHCSRVIANLDLPYRQPSRWARVATGVVGLALWSGAAVLGWRHTHPASVTARVPAFAPAPPFAAGETTFVNQVNASNRRADLRFPDIRKANSAFSVRYRLRYEEWRDRGDIRLSRPDWPERLAEEVSDAP